MIENDYPFTKTRQTYGPFEADKRVKALNHWKKLQDDFHIEGIRAWVEVKATDEGKFLSWICWNTFEVNAP